MRAILWKELKMRKWVILIVITAFIAFAFIEWKTYDFNLNTYKMMLKNPSHFSLTQTEKLKEELSRFRNFGAYMLVSWYLGLDTSIIWFVSIFIGSSLMGHEERKKTLDYLFTRPLKRENIIVSKFFAGVLTIAIINLVPIVAVPLISVLSGKNIAFSPFLYAFLISTIGWLAIYSIAFLASVLERFRTWIAFSTAIGIYLFWIAVKDIFRQQWIKSVDFNILFVNAEAYLSRSFGGYLPFVTGIGIIVVTLLLSMWRIREMDIL